MSEDISSEVKQPKRAKSSRYFETKNLPTIADVTSDPVQISTDSWRDKPSREKRCHYQFTSKLKGFVTHCTAIPVELWEAFRVDHRNSCGLCGLIVEDVNTLRKHIQEHLFLKCLICSSSFNLLDSFMSHMQQHTSTALPCSSAVINDKIGRESCLGQNREIAKTLTSVQTEREIVKESVVAQNELAEHESSSLYVCNSPNATNFDETDQETNLQEVELITGRNSSGFDGLQIGEAQFQPHTVKSVDNAGPTRSHCVISHINHSVPTLVNPLVCSICSFQTKSAEVLCKHNRQYHNLSSCFCQGVCRKDNVEKHESRDRATITIEKCSPQSEMSDPRIEISGVGDHASYCRPVITFQQNNDEIIDLDSDANLLVTPNQRSINANIETIICDDSSDSCIVFFGNTSQKRMPNPMQPLPIYEAGVQKNKTSSVKCTKTNNEPVKTPKSLATLDLKVDDPLNLLNEEDDNGRLFETVVVDYCKNGDVEVLEDSSKSKTLEVIRNTKESGEKYEVDKTVSELSLDEPSAKKRKRNNGCKSKALNGGSKSSSQKSKNRNTVGRVSSHEESGKKCEVAKTVSELSLDEPSVKKTKRHNRCKSKTVSGTKSSFQKSISRNTSGRVSTNELKSLFYDIPESIKGVSNTPATRRVTRHSVSSCEKSDPLKKTLNSTNNRSVDDRKKSKKNSSSNVDYSARPYTEKGDNVPKAAKINIELLDIESNRCDNKMSRVPSTLISGKDLKSCSRIVESSSQTAGSRANDRRWKQLSDDSEASSSSLIMGQRETKNGDNHWAAHAADDGDLSKTLTAGELESDILAGLSSFEVVDVMNIIESTQESYENEVDVSIKYKDPLDLSFEEALDLDSFCGVTEAPYVRQLSSSVVQFSNSEVLFDVKKFSTKNFTSKDIQIEDVPKLVEGQWIVYEGRFLRYNSFVNKVLAFSNKNFYFNFFSSEQRSKIISREKIIEDYTYFCDYRHGNHTTIPVKFKPLELKSNGSYIKLDGGTNETAGHQKGCAKVISPKRIMMNDSLSTKFGIGLAKFENEGNGAHVVIAENSTQYQEKVMSVQLEHETTYPLMGKETGLLESYEGDAYSVELENYTSNERWMELMNLEMEVNEQVGNIEENAIKTKDDASLEKPTPVTQYENSKSKPEENAALDNEDNGEASPVLINGIMQIMNSGSGDLKMGISPIFDKNSPNTVAGVAEIPINIRKSSYWGFSDSETDEEEAVGTPESPMNETIDAEKPVSAVPSTEPPENKPSAQKKSGITKFDWSGLDKMLKEIDEIPILGESIGKKVKGFSKTSASLPVHHSVLKDFDLTTDIPITHATEGNIENESHPPRRLDASLLDHQTISKNGMKEDVTICPTVMNKNQEKSCDTRNAGLQPGCRFVSNNLDLSTGISDDQLRNEEAVISPTLVNEIREKRSVIQNPGLQSSCSFASSNFDSSFGISGVQFRKEGVKVCTAYKEENLVESSGIQNPGLEYTFNQSTGVPSDQSKKNLRQMRNVCHSQRDMSMHHNHHRPSCNGESRDRGSFSPNDEREKRSEEWADFFRGEVEKYPHNVVRDSRFCERQTIDLERLYESLQKRLDRADEADLDSSDESVYCGGGSPSCSSGSFSPDCVDDIILQASHPREVSQPHTRDLRELRDYMSPPMQYRPTSNLSSMSREGIGFRGITPFSPTSPRTSLQTPHHCQRPYSSSSSSSASGQSTGSSAISLSPNFSDEYDFH